MILVNFCTGLKSGKANAESKTRKFMIISKRSYQPQKLSVNAFTINESDEVELLGLTIDKELRRIRKYLSLEKAKMFGNAFIDSQFNYAPLILMFCGKGLYLKI